MSCIRQETVSISADTVRSLIESYLRSQTIHKIADDEDVISMEYVPEALNNMTIIPFNFKLKKDQEIERWSANKGGKTKII